MVNMNMVMIAPGIVNSMNGFSRSIAQHVDVAKNSATVMRRNMPPNVSIIVVYRM